MVMVRVLCRAVGRDGGPLLDARQARHDHFPHILLHARKEEPLLQGLEGFLDAKMSGRRRVVCRGESLFPERVREDDAFGPVSDGQDEDSLPRLKGRGKVQVRRADLHQS